MFDSNPELPIQSAITSILEALRASNEMIVSAPPGSGKTTGITPELLGLLGAEEQILLLQPRRMAARTVANRLAEIMDSSVGDLVGYHVRMDKRWSSRTRIVVMTYGVLLRRLQRDPLLERVRIVLLDEFHERSLESDLALGMLSRVQTLRDDLKLVIMSATLDIKPIAEFLRDPAVISVEGRTHPLQIRYLDRSSKQRLEDQVADTLPHALKASGGHVLVFLPGIGEIRRTAKRISALSCCQDVAIMELYGDLAPQRQDAVLRQSAVRKIILSTNVAETSITIPNVDCVIDSGLARILRLDPAVGLPRLDIEPISRAAADQRAGRAGRTSAGVCYRLWMKAADRARADHEIPEVLRGDLASAVLQLYGWGESDILAFPWLTSPNEDSVKGAELLLARLGAIESGKITPLGVDMLSLPTHPRLARMLIYARDAGISWTASLCAAMLSERDPFIDRSSASRISHGHEKLLELDALDVVGRAVRLRHWADGANDPGIDKGVAFAVKRVANQLYDLIKPSGTGYAAHNVEQALQSPEIEVALAKSLLVAFPDRLARLRQMSGDRGLMVGGQGVRFKRKPGTKTDLLLCIELLRKSSDADVRLAAPIDRSWLSAGNLETRDEYFFHPSQRKVVGRKRIYWLDLVLDEQPIAVMNGGEASKILFHEVRARWNQVYPRNNVPLSQLLHRVTRLKQWTKNDDIPEMDQKWLEQVAEELCQGKLALDEVHHGPWLEAVRNRLGYDFVRKLASAVPDKICIPSGKEILIEYGETEQPAISARLQELFGWRETPRICNGRVPLLLRILAPNYREIQITSDLASFWQHGYFDVRKELRRRYPKHHWPEDPLSATATKSGLGRHADKDN